VGRQGEKSSGSRERESVRVSRRGRWGQRVSGGGRRRRGSRRGALPTQKTRTSGVSGSSSNGLIVPAVYGLFWVKHRPPAVRENEGRCQWQRRPRRLATRSFSSRCLASASFGVAVVRVRDSGCCGGGRGAESRAALACGGERGSGRGRGGVVWPRL
jgi:hypothetical protein